jgi:hypothetical protein
MIHTIQREPGHRIETDKRSTQPKKRNRHHAMICHQNADAMVLASAVITGMHPLDVPHFEYFQGVNASQKA